MAKEKPYKRYGVATYSGGRYAVWDKSRKTIVKGTLTSVKKDAMDVAIHMNRMESS